MQPGRGPPSAGRAGVAGHCVDIYRDSGKEQRHSAFHLLPVLKEASFNVEALWSNRNEV